MVRSWRVAAVAAAAMLLAGAVPSPAQAGGSPAGALSGASLAQGVGGAPLTRSAFALPGAAVAAELAAVEAKARLESPAAVAERAASRSKYAGYGRSAAVALAERAFGIERPQWSPPQGQGGGKITRYLGEDAAVEALPSGRHLLVESSTPLRSAMGSGKLAPVSLSLQASGSGYDERNPLVAVQIGRSAAEGATFSWGARVAPTEHAAPESSVQVGNGIFYPGTAKASDFMLEPLPSGVEASWQLLSAQSPEANALTFSLPAGAKLQLSKSFHGAAEVVSEGKRLLWVMPAMAKQADGQALPASYTVSGDTLTTHVDLSGSVDFPVEVDPVVAQEYGGSSGYWAGWNQAGTAGAYFEGGQSNSGILAGIAPGSAAASWAAWGLYAPGWSTKEGSVTRVDVTGLVHHCCDESDIEAGIAESNGSEPTWTFNGTIAADTKSGPLKTGEDLSAMDAAFCAQNGYGADGTSTPLCNEGYGGNYFHLSVFTWATQPYRQYDMIEGTTARFLDSSKLSAGFSTAPTIEGRANVLASGGWLSEPQGAFEEMSADPAFGVAGMTLSVYRNGEWVPLSAHDYQGEGQCLGVVCGASQHEAFTYDTFPGALPNGEDQIRVEAKDPSGIPAVSQATLRVDNSLPHGLVVTGNDVKENVANITEGTAGSRLTFSATDGWAGTPSSGIKELELAVDKHAIGAPRGSCSPGPCTASGTWTLNGAELGVGVHKLELGATSNSGKVTHKEYTLVVNAASPVAIGPGSVNPESGDFAMEASDAQLSGGEGALAVSRHYDSRNVKEGEGGPLGPQWTIALGSFASLEVLPDKSVVVVGPEGILFFSAKEGGGYESPQGYSTLKLSLSGSEYVLENTKERTTTAFTLPEGSPTGSEAVWKPTASKGAVSTNTVTATYKALEEEGKKIVEPIMELEPHAGSLKCSPEAPAAEHMQRGCRALVFTYAEETTASGEAQSEWGQYKGRLQRISAVAWNPAASEMQEKAIAEYAYNSKGWLRAEWNPSIKPALKTIYGYDAEGHITAVSPPGQQPWLMTYGSTPEDGSTGRLLKVARASVSSKLWEGALPGSTGAPALSGSAVVGNRMSVSDGQWSGSPDGYAYYWEDCNGSGGECARIDGATNPNYTPVSADVGHTLRAVVAATNSGGTVLAASAPSEVTGTGAASSAGEARQPAPGSTIEYGLPVSGAGAPPYPMGAKELSEDTGQTDVPAEATAIFPPEHPQSWPASNYSGASIDYMDIHARLVNVASPDEGISTTEYDKEGDVVRALSAANRQRALKASNHVEVASHLATVSKYGEEGSQLEETTGPEHKVKLATGEEVMARNHVRYFYDEGAPAEDQNAGLVTKTTDGALLANGEEKDARTTLTEYAGQNDLGWKLRQPTSTTTDPGGLSLTTTTIYNPANGDVIETRSPGAGPAEVTAARVVDSFGGAEPGGTLSRPQGVALNKTTGDVYVADTGNSRIVQLSPSGEFIRSFGSQGSGAGELKHPEGIAVDSEGDVWVADTGNNRVVEFSGSGEYLQEISRVGFFAAAFEECVHKGTSVSECEKTSGPKFEEYEEADWKLSEPADVAIGSEGNLEIVDTGESSVLEVSPLGSLENWIELPSSGEHKLERPVAAAVSSSGSVWVAGTGSYGVEEFGAGYAREPVKEVQTEGAVRGLTIDGEGNVWLSGDKISAIHETYYERKVVSGEIVELGKEGEPKSGFDEEGSASGQFRSPSGIAAGPESKLWVADTGNDRVQETLMGVVSLAQFPLQGASVKQLKFDAPTGAAVDSNGDVFVADTGNDRIQQVTSEGFFVRMFGSEGAGNGQLDHPEGVTVGAKGDVWVADTANNRIEEFSGEGAYVSQIGKLGSGDGEFNEPSGVAVAGEDLYVVDRGNKRIQEIKKNGEFVRAFGTEGEGKLVEPQAITIDKEGHVWVTDRGTGRVLEYNAEGKVMTVWGQKGEGDGQFMQPDGIQVTEAGNVWVSDAADNRVQELTSSGTFLQGLGSTKPLQEPVGLALDRSTGRLAVVNSDSGITQVWQPGSISHEAAGSGGVHGVQSVYYTAGVEAGVAACRDHPEWAGLACQSQPAAQPEGSVAPPLPVKTIAYNMWDQPETITEAFGATVRTDKTTYDEAGRQLTSAVTSNSGDETVPVVSYHYSETTGALVKTSQVDGKGEEQAISEQVNSLGQLESYTDASGNMTSYTYDKYGRPVEVNFDATRLDGLEAVQRYSYEEATGQLSEVEVPGVGTFKDSYGVEGELASEAYPNGMLESFVYNAIGEATSVKYEKTTDCASECVWYSDSVVPSVHGEAVSQQSTLGSQAYVYDAAGRLTQVQETPVGEGCSTRLFAYDVESNRVSETTRKPGAEGRCASEGGETLAHAYDEANRLTDEGIVYEKLGNVTSLPGVDAGGKPISSSYFADGKVATQHQGASGNIYAYDPVGRTMSSEAVVEPALTGAVSVDHYAGESSTPSWTYDSATAVWTRNISGASGLVAIQEEGKAAVLPLLSLQGEVVGTASLSETAAKPLSLERASEFGVPLSGKQVAKYSWLAGLGVSVNLESETVVKDGVTAVPLTGGPLQSEGTPLPAPPNIVTPAVIEVSPFVPVNYVAAQSKVESSEVPAGNVPSPDGECRGTAAVNNHACWKLSHDPQWEHLYFDEYEVDQFVAAGGGTGTVNMVLWLSKLEGELKTGPIEWLEHQLKVHTPSEWGFAILEGAKACAEAMYGDRELAMPNAQRCEVSIPWTFIQEGPVTVMRLPDLGALPIVSLCVYYRTTCGSYSNGEFNY